MRNDKIKYDLTIRQNGIKLAKGKNMNIDETIAKIKRTADKKISGAIDNRLFGGIVVSIACFGTLAQHITCMGMA